MKNIKQLYLGIDWGTHSSKWAADIITKDGKTDTRSNLISSDLLFHEKKITINPSDSYQPSIKRTISLKRYIILDPHGPFWVYDRADIGMPLGMGVLFSICSLLGDFLAFIKKNQMQIDSSTELEIGFSFPNWLKDKDPESRTAVNHYHQSIILACYLLQYWSKDLPVPNKPYDLTSWKELVNKSIRKISFPKQSKITIADMTITNYMVDQFCNEEIESKLNWRYLVESCAAGLPYLRNIELKSPPGLKGLGKLLVIDIGAGSTDIGYMLRTISRAGKENLFYFTPAQTLRVAGNDLTDKIRDYHHSAGKHITFLEAEAFKISKTDDWIDNPFVINWRNIISENIKQYMKIVPDKKWLELNIPLQIIITGGSGFVPGLADEIKLKVSEGLRSRKVSSEVAYNLILFDNQMPNWQFKSRQDYARMAVAIGSSDKDKPSLKYLHKMDPPTPRQGYTRTTKYK